MELEYTDGPQVPVMLEGVLEDMDMRGVTFTFAAGPVQGYQWRYLVSHHATAATPARAEWTPWVFGSIQQCDGMLAAWQEFLRTHGHLATGAPPGSTTQ